MADMPTLFFDVGGVFLTNGWDTGSRSRAAEVFGLDYPEFQTRHEMLKTAFETGRLFAGRLPAQGHLPQAEKLPARRLPRLHVRPVATAGRHPGFHQGPGGDGPLSPLHPQQRVPRASRAPGRGFDLGSTFRAFFTSCYLGQAKPDEDIYLNALGIAGCSADHASFIDDRSLNVEPATTLGLHAIQFEGLDGLRGALKDRGIVA